MYIFSKSEKFKIFNKNKFSERGKKRIFFYAFFGIDLNPEKKN